jgi:DNA-binding NarL/FixJ family response regulator
VPSQPARLPGRRSTKRTAVLLDQHPLWLQALEQVLTKINVEVVGKATDPEKALAVIEEREPDIFVTSIEMPRSEMDGLACLRAARERLPELKAIVLSMYADPFYVDAALAAGALAYVVKTAEPEDIAAAIRQAFEHSIHFAGSSGGAQVSALGADEERRPGLTRRELEILRLVSEGHTNAELARMLWVTEQTVKFHLANIYRKLGVSNRTEAARYVFQHGLAEIAPKSA